MTEHQKIKKLIDNFATTVLFNPEFDHLKIQSTHLEHNDGVRSAVVITSDEKNVDAVKEIVGPYFKGVPLIVRHEEGAAEFTFTLLNGKGVKNFRSNKWGTIAGYFKNSGKFYGLSNAHVLADYGRGRKKDKIICAPNINAGTLVRFYNLKKPPSVNRVDAGIFEVASGHKPAWKPAKPKSMKPLGARVNLRVTKKGFASKDTTGVITAVNAYDKVDFNGQTYFFKNIIKIEGLQGKDFNQEGDSGSLVLSHPNRYMVALVFAKKNHICYALPIANALRLFKLLSKNK
ncbi:MAG: hypothetical protein ABJM06_07205 [Gilvibacter sp.]